MATKYATQYAKTQTNPPTQMASSHEGSLKFMYDTYSFVATVGEPTIANLDVAFGMLEKSKIMNVILTFANFDAFEGMFTVSLGGVVLAKMDVENGSIRLPLTTAIIENAATAEVKITFENGCDSTAGDISLTVLYFNE